MRHCSNLISENKEEVIAQIWTETDKNYFVEHFKDFLVRKLGIDRAAIPNPIIWSGTGETVGVLSLKLNLLTTEITDVVTRKKQNLQFRETVKKSFHKKGTIRKNFTITTFT